VRRCKNLLKNILNRAIVHGIIDNNPIESYSTVREPKSDGREILYQGGNLEPGYLLLLLPGSNLTTWLF